MPLDTAACLQLLEILSRDDAVRCTVTSSLRNGAIVGASTVVGSLLLGPAGVAVGAGVGTVLAYRTGRNNYVSLITAVRQMPPQQQARLVEEVNRVVSGFSYEDVLVLQAALVSGAALGGLSAIGRAALLAGLRSFFASNTSYTLDGS